jgi:hypothetical protein
MAETDLDICVQTLSRLGQGAIDSFTDGTPNSIRCANTYPDFRIAMLNFYPWKFATAERQLAQVAGADPLGFEFLYQLPAEALDAPEALYSDTSKTRIKHYEIIGNQVKTNFQEVFARYQVDVPENFWPPVFTLFVIEAYAASIAVAVTEEQSLANRLEAAAWGNTQLRNGGLFAAAKRIDARRSSQRSMLEGGGPLIQAREGGALRDFAGVITE